MKSTCTFMLLAMLSFSLVGCCCPLFHGCGYRTYDDGCNTCAPSGGCATGNCGPTPYGAQYGPQMGPEYNSVPTYAPQYSPYGATELPAPAPTGGELIVPQGSTSQLRSPFTTTSTYGTVYHDPVITAMDPVPTY